MSKFTDNASPFPQGNNYSGKTAISNAVRAATFGGLAGSTAGASIPMAIGAVAGGRMIDAITGRRSKVRRYINRNKGNQGLGVVSGLGEVDKGIARTKKYNEEALEKAKQATAAERAKNYYNYTQNSPPHPDSPQGIYQRFTGLDRAGLENTIDEILADSNFDPQMRLELEDLVESMKFGGQVSGFAALRHINGVLDRIPEESNPRVAMPEDRVPNGTPFQVVESQYVEAMSSRQYNGMVSNNLAVENLKEKLLKDDSVSTVDKEHLNNALDKMLLHLGSDPASTVIAVEKSLQELGVPLQHINSYFTPYKNRVLTQQETNNPAPQQNPQQGQPPNPTDQQPLL